MQVWGELPDSDEPQDGGGEETDLQARDDEEPESDEVQTGNEEDEESFSQTGVQEGRRREGGEVCGDGEITWREAGSQEMFLPSQDHLPSCGGTWL